MKSQRCKYDKLDSDLKEIVALVREAVKDISDDGERNLDTAALCYPHSHEMRVQNAAISAGIFAERIAVGVFLIYPPVNASGRKRAVQAELMMNELIKRGYHAYIWHNT